MSVKKSRKEGRNVGGSGGKGEGAMIAALQKKTSLTEAEIKEQHQMFKKMCPQGLVSNHSCFIAKASIFPDDKEAISGQLP